MVGQQAELSLRLEVSPAVKAIGGRPIGGSTIFNHNHGRLAVDGKLHLVKKET
jgi:hypothetical protein